MSTGCEWSWKRSLINQGLSLVRLIEAIIVPFRVVFEAGVFSDERQGDRAGWPVTLFLDDDLRFAFDVLVRFVIDLFAVNKHDDVSVLLDGAGFSEVRHLRLSAGTIFHFSIQLR